MMEVRGNEEEEQEEENDDQGRGEDGNKQST